MDEIAKNHHAGAAWRGVMASVGEEIARRRAHPARTIVLVPYAQLIQVARSAWADWAAAQGRQAYFTPRFETTMNWSRSLGGFEPAGDDLRLDAARDVLTAASLLERSGLGAQQAALAGGLMQAAWSLARLAAAVAPAQRSAWGARLAADLGAQAAAPAVELDARLGRIALAWAANSGYATDSVFAARGDLMVLLQGLQPEPLHDALRALWSDRVVSLSLQQDGEPGAIALHRANDSEDEAERAAACVLAHLAQGRTPVALVAQDRIVTRRVGALLRERGVPVRDETGWTLSTTRAAATVMGLLRAAAWDASTDDVLDWAKNAGAVDASALRQLETDLRSAGTRQWRSVPVADALTTQLEGVREALRAARPLSGWLVALRGALRDAGQWQPLEDDAAGQAVLDTLRLRDGAQREFADVTRRMAPGSFVAWVAQALEGASFLPPHPAQARVLVMPLSQLLGRDLAAVVMPGCDDIRLPASPEAPGAWSPAQRAILGLPQRDALQVQANAAWRCALQFPRIDLLWRNSEAGERLVPSAFLQALLLQGLQLAADPRAERVVHPVPCHMPKPTGQALPRGRVSASAYEDLRRCPYRFFALRQLRLQESEELDAAVDKRDFGNWIHLLLKHFHVALVAAPDSPQQSFAAMLDAAAGQAAQELGLADSEFIPFAASWPRVRAGYLDWMSAHHGSGARFLRAEAWCEMPLGELTLVGRIDRIDRLADGSTLVIDYKTEAVATTSARIRNPHEDTQLAFYAALLEDDTLSAMYLNVGESEPARAFAQADIVGLRDRLVHGIQDDMRRIGAGARLPAIGAGAACDYCAARGLCRKDFWERGGGPAAGAVDA